MNGKEVLTSGHPHDESQAADLWRNWAGQLGVTESL